MNSISKMRKKRMNENIILFTKQIFIQIFLNPGFKKDIKN